MATDLRTQPKHEQFVEEQLERVSRRLHAFDLGRVGLLLLALVMAHALVMALIDNAAGTRSNIASPSAYTSPMLTACKMKLNQ